MKLKEIPQNTVVHTPTEEEAKELLAILHENGYTYYDGTSLLDNDWLIYWYDKDNELESLGIEPSAKITKHIEHCHIGWFRKQGHTILTLAEFKERYLIPSNSGELESQPAEKEPQPKYHLGERIRIVSSGEDDYINMITQDDCYELLEHRGKYEESDLEPYTEPETKPTEDMETKEKEPGEKGNNPQNSQLDLCELLKGRCTTFYSPMWGDTDVLQLYDVNLRIAPCKGHATWLNTDEQGKCDDDGICMLWPSRALYEQYPLDPYTAWMKWQEEQRTYEIKVSIDYCENFMGVVDDFKLTFRTPADRDKCIEEIKAIIEKYSKE